MRLSCCFCLVAALVSCGPEVREPPPSVEVAPSAPAPETAEVAKGKAPHIARKPDLQPGNILSEKMNWSRVDMSVRLEVTIDASGAVVATSLESVSPPASELALELGRFVSERFNTAVFEAPSEFSYPHSFEVTINFPAPRDESGRLK